MDYVFRFSKARVKHEPPAPVVPVEPIRCYPNGGRIDKPMESWRIRIEQQKDPHYKRPTYFH